MEMQEWFRDHLREVGHRRLGDFFRITYRTPPERVLERLKALWDTYYVVTIPVRDSMGRCEEVGELLNAGDHQFAPWTSFAHEATVYFVFRTSRDAAIFRLLLPD